VKQQPVPAEPPSLKFVRALHEGGGAVPVHELVFGESFTHRNRRPTGAVRLELFVDLLHPDEEIPPHPGANHGGRPWYLRSFSRSPIKLSPPMTRQPMRVVYWGRWADSMGNVGPFSATAVGWVEGASMHRMGIDTGNMIGGYKRAPLLEEATAPAGREQTISVLVMEAQYQSLHPQMVVQPMPAIAGSEARRLEGQRGEEAA
jgi:hypothetical protein